METRSLKTVATFSYLTTGTLLSKPVVDTVFQIEQLGQEQYDKYV